MGQSHMGSRNPFAGDVLALCPHDFELLCEAVERRKCRESLGVATLAEAADEFRAHPACPYCGCAGTVKDGRTASGVQRWSCPQCKGRYTSLSGTVFEHTRMELSAWVAFIRLMRFNVSLDCIAEALGITHQTAWEWRHRVFATVDGYQDRIVLRDRVWIDETYVSDTDLSHGYGQAKKRGLSKQKLCIAVAIDVHKNPVAVVCGHGKPSTKRIKAALGGHLAKGCVIVHDKEKAHKGLIRQADAVSEAYKADVRDPVYLEQMALVNNLCTWVKRYLWRFTGMGMANMQSYLNWYVYLFRVNQAKDKWPETARVLRHLMMTKASFRSSR